MGPFAIYDSFAGLLCKFILVVCMVLHTRFACQLDNANGQNICKSILQINYKRFTLQTTKQHKMNIKLNKQHYSHLKSLKIK